MQSKLSKDGSIHVTDEKINTISHLAAAIFSILGAVLLIVQSSAKANPWAIVSFSIYGVSLVGVFFASALHHGVNSNEPIEAFLRQIDYIAIFPLIAGTFTPICLILYRTIIGWSIFGVIWALAGIGIAIKSVFPKVPKWVFGTMYISMGWIGVFLIIPVFEKAGIAGLIFLIGGAFFYSAGFTVFNVEKPNPMEGKFGFHEIWHILVIFGAIFHYFMMYFTILPLS